MTTLTDDREASVLEALKHHIASERDLIEEYGRFAEEAEEEHVRYLVRLVIDDETRHHQVFIEIENALRSIDENHEILPRVPPLNGRRRDRAGLREVTSRFLEEERRDLRALQHLKRELRPVRATTLWALLIELSILDTRKHIAILRFIARTA